MRDGEAWCISDIKQELQNRVTFTVEKSSVSARLNELARFGEIEQLPEAAPLALDRHHVEALQNSRPAYTNVDRNQQEDLDQGPEGGATLDFAFSWSAT